MSVEQCRSTYWGIWQEKKKFLSLCNFHSIGENIDLKKKKTKIYNISYCGECQKRRLESGRGQACHLNREVRKGLVKNETFGRTAFKEREQPVLTETVLSEANSGEGNVNN